MTSKMQVVAEVGSTCMEVTKLVSALTQMAYNKKEVEAEEAEEAEAEDGKAAATAEVEGTAKAELRKDMHAHKEVRLNINLSSPILSTKMSF